MTSLLKNQEKHFGIYTLLFFFFFFFFLAEHKDLAAKQHEAQATWETSNKNSHTEAAARINFTLMALDPNKLHSSKSETMSVSFIKMETNVL